MRVLLLSVFVATFLEGCCRVPPPEVVAYTKGCKLPPVPVRPSLSSARTCGNDLCLSVPQVRALEIYLIRARAWIDQALACSVTPTSRPTR